MARIASDTDNTAVSCPLVHLTPPHTHIYIQYIFICTCQFYIPDSLAAGTLYTVDRKPHPRTQPALLHCACTSLQSLAWQNIINENTILRTFLWGFLMKNIIDNTKTYTQFTQVHLPQLYFCWMAKFLFTQNLYRSNVVIMRKNERRMNFASD